LKNKEKVLSDRVLFSRLEGATPARKTVARVGGKSARVIIGAKPKEIAEIERKKEGQDVLS
jgi:hypothetical protein